MSLGRALFPIVFLALTQCGGVYDLAASNTDQTVGSQSPSMEPTGGACPKQFASFISEPQPDGTACEEFAFAADQTLLRRTVRSVSVNGSNTTKTTEVYDENQHLHARYIDQFVDGLLESTSAEALWLPASAGLPDSPNLPGTWKTTFSYDVGGRKIGMRFDRGIDGDLEFEQRWTYHENGKVREYVRRGSETSVEALSELSPSVAEVWTSDGQLISRLDETKSGRVNTYAESGLLASSDNFTNGVVTSRDEWTLLDRDHPRVRKHVEITPAGNKLVAEEQFEYHDTGALKLRTVWELIADKPHNTRYEYDRAGRETSMLAVSPDSRCERTSIYDAQGRALRVRSECDDKGADETINAFNDRGQIVYSERTWMPLTKVRVDRTEYAYNTCGGLASVTAVVDGKLISKRGLRYDQSGLITEEVLGGIQNETVHRYAYDDAGRLVSRDADRWTFTSDSRLSERAYGEPVVLESGMRPVAHISYRYQCSLLR